MANDMRILEEVELIEPGINFAEEPLRERTLHTRWRWDGSLAPDGEGLPFVVNVRRF